MAFVQNFPFFCILLCMMAAIVSSILRARAALCVSVALSAVVTALNACVLAFTLASGESYVYFMGHFPAPWGNELRAGALEALLGLALSLVVLMSQLGGMRKLCEQIEESKRNLYCIMLDLTLAATMALIYTNDLFTAYVFIEIMTIAACALTMARQNGHTLVAAMRYMIMNLLGSGLVLIGISMVYTLTGHLLMENIRESIAVLYATGQYATPITVVVALLTVGLSIKSALFPFHAWLPDAYGYSTPTSSAILSSVVSKAYIFLLMKIFYRVIGMDIIAQCGIGNVLFGFGCAGIIMGSVGALRQREIRRMIAFSSVAQIGYIYVGIGLCTDAGLVAAVLQMLVHSAAKSMLFLSASGLSDVSGDSKQFRYLRGSGFLNPPAGAAFTAGALSMVGVPFLGGFISKVYLCLAGMEAGGARRVIVLAALAVSTLLNAAYFLHTVVSIYRKPQTEARALDKRSSPLASVMLFAFIVLNVALGVTSPPIVRAIEQGLSVFG